MSRAFVFAVLLTLGLGQEDSDSDNDDHFPSCVFRADYSTGQSASNLQPGINIATLPPLAAVQQNACWMAKVKGNTKLTKLILPASHDTVSVRRSSSPTPTPIPVLINSILTNPGLVAHPTLDLINLFFDTQTWNVRAQLDAGIRFLDVRCLSADNKCFLQHEDKLYGTFESVRDALHTFLRDNPSETVIIRNNWRLRANQAISPFFASFPPSVGTLPDSRLTSLEIINSYITPGNRSRWIINPPSIERLRLRDTRGKVVLLMDDGSAGLQFYTNNVIVQDQFQLLPMIEKKEVIRRFWRDTIDRSVPKFQVNFLSANPGFADPFRPPIVFAGGLPAPTRTPPVIDGNNMIPFEFTGFLGVVMMDFPSEGVITHLINQNFLSSTVLDAKPVWAPTRCDAPNTPCLYRETCTQCCVVPAGTVPGAPGTPGSTPSTASLRCGALPTKSESLQKSLEQPLVGSSLIEIDGSRLRFGLPVILIAGSVLVAVAWVTRRQAKRRIVPLNVGVAIV